MAGIEDILPLVQDIIDLTAIASNVVSETPVGNISEPQGWILQNLHDELGRTIRYATSVQAPLKAILSGTGNERCYQNGDADVEMGDLLTALMSVQSLLARWFGDEVTSIDPQGGYGKIAGPWLVQEYSAKVLTAFVQRTPLSLIPGAFSVLGDLCVEVMDRRQEVERAFQCASNQIKARDMSMTTLSDMENAHCTTLSAGYNMQLDPGLILTLVQGVLVASDEACGIIDKAFELASEESHALKELQYGILSLRSDAVVYRDITISMCNGDRRGADPPFSDLMQRQDVTRAMGELAGALRATQLLLQPNSAGSSRVMESRRPFMDVLKALGGNVGSILERDFNLTDVLKDATYEVHICEQNNERTFKRVWNLYTAIQQQYIQSSSIDDDDIRRKYSRAVPTLQSFLRVFNVHPFAVSPGVSFEEFATLNADDIVARQYKELAGRIGRVWVGDRLPQDSADLQDLGALQTSIFELLWSGTIEQLKWRGVNDTDDPERLDFERSLAVFEKTLQEAVVRSKKQRFAIAFCGMVKAGKSLFLNALIGRAVLPSDELPSTAWPCRIRHVEGQTIPELHFRAAPFLVALRKLRARRYGRKMQTYQPPTENDELLFDPPPQPSEETIRLKIVYSQWVDLHAATRRNLLSFEASCFKLPRMAKGGQEVKNLLGQLNDIVRLCQRFELGFDMTSVDWPVLTVEFNSLSGRRMDGIYEFIDLPGIGESFRDFNFESLVRLVAADSNAIVPVVSFKELPRSDWRRLPELVASSSSRRAKVVVCTHLDQISPANMEEQLRTVSKVFWPGSPLDTDRIIPCSSLMGLSAMDLLEKSRLERPPFETIWNSHTTGYHCAVKLLGLANSRSHYSIINDEAWNAQLMNELQYSGLPQAIQKLTTEIVDSGRTNALLNESENIIRQLRKIKDTQERQLLEIRRDMDDYSAAKRAYERVCVDLEAVLNAWDTAGQEQMDSARHFLDRASAMVSTKAYGFINQAIAKTLQDWQLGNVQVEDAEATDRGALEAFPTESVKVLTVKNVTQAEEFLRLSQRELHLALNGLQLDYVATVRKLAESAKEKRFQALRDAIILKPWILSELRDNIVDDLESQSIDIRKVALHHVRNLIKVTATRHTAQTAFRAIEGKLARAWLGSSSPAIDYGKSETKDDNIEEAVQKGIDELGFMLRAPIAVLATVPFVFGLPIWPWVVRFRTYRLEMDTIYNRYKDEIVDPWIGGLAEEGKNSLIGTIEMSSQVARDLVTSALEREANRYNRELELKTSVDPQALVSLIVDYGNLVAAEEALKSLLVRIKGLERH